MTRAIEAVLLFALLAVAAVSGAPELEEEEKTTPANCAAGCGKTYSKEDKVRKRKGLG